jgi:oligopeptidase A
MNPLLNFADNHLPLYDQIKPEHIDPALDILLARAKYAFNLITNPAFPADWDAMAKIFDIPSQQLSMAWGTVAHLKSVVDTPELRAVFNKNVPRMTEYGTMVGSSAELFAKYKAIDPATLNDEQKRALHLAVQGFVLGGAELVGADKERFAAIQERQSTLSRQFSDNVMDATDAFAYYATLEELDGLPEDSITTARDAAEADGKEGYKLTLKMPCYVPVMQFAKSSALREIMYRGNSTRASDQAAGDAVKFDNTEIIREILALKHEEALLLGYNNFAEVSVKPKMADSPEQVSAFLRDFAAKAKPFAVQDLANLREHAAVLGINDPQPWDWAYIGEKLKESKYSYSEQEVKEYFPINKVLDGLFGIAEKLFEIKISPDTASVWHPCVTFYKIERNGELVGQFYLDPTARNGKRSGAWMNDVRTRQINVETNKLETPVAYLVCNFSDGIDGQPAFLTHDDVTTLFHEFGHGIHHMLTQVTEGSISGINGFEWDAVEMPSQFMENFCWEWDVVEKMTAHCDTGLPIPKELFDKMYAAKNFQSGLGTVRQMEMSLFDMVLHMHLSDDDFADVQKAIRDEISVLIPPTWVRTAHTFTHIFTGGYSAGYYSYKWAEVLSADAYAAFEETNNSLETSRRYRQEILEKGASRPAMESFIAFRGRAPTPDALLRHQGMSV